MRAPPPASTIPRSTRSAAKFRRAFFEGEFDTFDDLLDGFSQTFSDFNGVDPFCDRQACDLVAAAHFHFQFVIAERIGGADGHFDLFSRSGADHQIVGTAHVVDDALVEFIPGDAQASGTRQYRREK